MKNGRVAPYREDLDAYRHDVLNTARPSQKDATATKTAGKQAKVEKKTKIAHLQATLRKAEERVEKLLEMSEKLSQKLADPTLYDNEHRSDLLVWQKKYTEVEDALERAETLWDAAQDDLKRAEASQGNERKTGI